MHGYRTYRRRLVLNDEEAAERLVIGIDVDDVLADQISGVLPRIKQRFDVGLTYADITDWRLPIRDTDIAQEIVAAQRDRDYVLDMHVHEGANRLLKFLHRTNRIVIITARQGEAAATWTAEWLRRNNLLYDEVVSGTEARKSEHRTNVLIDDYIGNLVEFLNNTNGVAVLVDQPWNRQRQALDAFAEAKRLFVVANLHELLTCWPDVAEQAAPSREHVAVLKANV
jgi:5'(3')-deoxyribonucleotidase